MCQIITNYLFYILEFKVTVNSNFRSKDLLINAKNKDLSKKYKQSR
jgi:hypothetical protein